MKKNPVSSLIQKVIGSKPFESPKYWETRYRSGGTSGAGSAGDLALFKAKIINDFCLNNDIQSTVELGCGDGQQLALFDFKSYVGLDISPSAIELCKKRFADQKDFQFELYRVEAFNCRERFDLALSIDVIYHLIEDDLYEKHLRHLFEATRNYVIIYSCDLEGGNFAPHVKPRKFTSYISRHFPNFVLNEHIKNPRPLDQYGTEKGSWSDFYIFQKSS